jgi:hypothetical protein
MMQTLAEYVQLLVRVSYWIVMMTRVVFVIRNDS